MDNREYKTTLRHLKTACVVSRQPTTTGGKRFVVRTGKGEFKTVTTSPSSVASMDRAVKLYKKALKSLATK